MYYMHNVLLFLFISPEIVHVMVYGLPWFNVYKEIRGETKHKTSKGNLAAFIDFVSL